MECVLQAVANSFWQQSSQTSASPFQETAARSLQHNAEGLASSQVQSQQISQNSYAPRQLAAAAGSRYYVANAAPSGSTAASQIPVQRAHLHLQPLVLQNSEKMLQVIAGTGAMPEAPNKRDLYTKVTGRPGAKSPLYASTPLGRPPGRRCAMVRWVLTQRALWLDGQLSPVQMQYMAILGDCLYAQNHLAYCFNFAPLQAVSVVQLDQLGYGLSCICAQICHTQRQQFTQRVAIDDSSDTHLDCRRPACVGVPTCLLCRYHLGAEYASDADDYG